MTDPMCCPLRARKCEQYGKIQQMANLDHMGWCVCVSLPVSDSTSCLSGSVATTQSCANAFITVSLSVITFSPLPVAPHPSLHLPPSAQTLFAINTWRMPKKWPVLNDGACAQSGEGAAAVSHRVFMLMSIWFRCLHGSNCLKHIIYMFYVVAWRQTEQQSPRTSHDSRHTFWLTIYSLSSTSTEKDQ